MNCTDPDCPTPHNVLSGSVECTITILLLCLQLITLPVCFQLTLFISSVKLFPFTDFYANRWILEQHLLSTDVRRWRLWCDPTRVTCHPTFLWHYGDSTRRNFIKSWCRNWSFWLFFWMILDDISTDKPNVHYVVFVAVNSGIEPTFHRC